VLLGVLSAEFLLVATVVVTLLVDLPAAPTGSWGATVALLVLAILAVLWLGAIIVGAWRGRAWVRGAGIVWQVLQFAVGLGALQGAFAQPAWGWPLAGSALVAFLLLISRPVAGTLVSRGDAAPRS
jgi:hypothetical protein